MQCPGVPQPGAAPLLPRPAPLQRGRRRQLQADQAHGLPAAAGGAPGGQHHGGPGGTGE